jgi:surface protein
MILKYNNRVVTHNNRWVDGHDPLNPLDLPPYTIRLLYPDGYSPKSSGHGSWKRVSSSPNIWDVTYENNNWSSLLDGQFRLLAVICANSSNVTNMSNMFNGCDDMESVALFNTSNVTNMNNMFKGCTVLQQVPLYNTSKVTNMSGMFSSCAITTVPLFDMNKVTDCSYMFMNAQLLQEVPLFDTSKVTNMNSMFLGCKALTYIPLFDTSKVYSMGSTFSGCVNVQYGALALYKQASTQATPPHSHSGTFNNCGINTTTGRAEWNQIPYSWGGNA